MQTSEDVECLNSIEELISSLKISIPSYSYKSELKVYFKIDVEIKGMGQWNVEKMYSDFEEMHL